MAKKKSKNKHKRNKSKRRSGQTVGLKNQWLWLLGGAALCFIIYTPILGADFLNYDDDLYIRDNPLMQSFTWNNLSTLFTEFFGNQYAPLAMGLMSLEIAIVGMDPGALKFFSIILHILNVAAIFIFVKKLTDWPLFSIIVAILFGVHTLQVESVAWLAASMKIGTYSLFLVLSLIQYLYYIDKWAVKNYYLSLLFFLFACLSKEQAVVLPVILFGLDYIRQRSFNNRKLWLEKIPFFLFALVFGLLTLTVADDMRGTDMALPYSIGERLVFASYAVTSYLMKMVLPLELSTFYVYPVVGKTPSWYYLSFIVAIGILAGTYIAWKKDKRLVVFGSLFFLANIALTLLSQVLSVRDVMMADRYVYLSIAGFYIALLPLLKPLLPGKNWGDRKLLAVAGIYVIILSVLTYNRTEVWKGDTQFMADAIRMAHRWDKANSPAMAVPHTNMGVALKDQGKTDEAIENYRYAIACNPNYSLAYTNLGNTLMLTGQLAEAEENYNKSLSISPDNEKALSGRGAVYAQTGRNEQALKDFEKAIQLNPRFKDVYSNRFLTYYQMQRYQDALADVKKLTELDPDDASAYHDMGVTLSLLGRKQEALEAYNQAVRFAPNNGNYYFSRAAINRDLGNRQQAYSDALRAQQLGTNVDPAFLQSVQ